MTYTERREFTYDTELFQRHDSQTAARIHDEYITRHSSVPTPKFFEISREPGDMDPLWHESKHSRIPFTQRSPLEIPAINQFTKQAWKNSKLGRYAERDDIFWVSRLALQRFNYFPEGGDLVFWNGRRYQIIVASIPPTAYWGQTGVWLGLICECMIAPEGDAKPVADLSIVAPSELSDVPGPLKVSSSRPLQVQFPLPER